MASEIFRGFQRFSEIFRGFEARRKIPPGGFVMNHRLSECLGRHC